MKLNLYVYFPFIQTASPAVVQTTTPEINSFAKQGRSDGECAEGTGCVKQSTMPGKVHPECSTSFNLYLR